MRRAIVVVGSFILLPLAALLQGLIASNTLKDSIDAWQGKFESLFMMGQFVNPWLDLLPGLIVLIVVYFLISVAGIGVVRYVRRESPVYPFRLVIGLTCTGIGVLVLYNSIIVAGLSYTYFVDVRLGGMYFPLYLAKGGSIFALAVNALHLIAIHNRVNGQSLSSV